MINYHLDMALFVELCVGILLAYCKPFNVGFNTRALASPHFAVISVQNFAKLIMYDEVRKILVRKGTALNEQGRIVYKGWIARNTYW